MPKKPRILIEETTSASATTGSAYEITQDARGFSINGRTTVAGDLEIQRQRGTDESTWETIHTETLGTGAMTPLIFEFNPWKVRARFTPDSSATFSFEAMEH